MLHRAFPKLRTKFVVVVVFGSVALPRTNPRMIKDSILSFSQFFLFIFSYTKRLHPKNCLGVRQFAETMMCAVLYDAANSFIHQHFVEVSASEEFLALPLEDVLELVSRDELNVKSEEQVCRAHGPTVGDKMEIMTCMRLLFIVSCIFFMATFYAF